MTQTDISQKGLQLQNANNDIKLGTLVDRVTVTDRGPKIKQLTQLYSSSDTWCYHTLHNYKKAMRESNVWSTTQERVINGHVPIDSSI